MLLVGDAMTAEADVGDISDEAGTEEETDVVEFDNVVTLELTREGEVGRAEADSAATAWWWAAT